MPNVELAPFSMGVKRVLVADRWGLCCHNQRRMHAHRTRITSNAGRLTLRRPKAKPYRRPGRRRIGPRALGCFSMDEWVMLMEALEEGELPANLAEVLTCPEEDTLPEEHGKIHPPWYRRVG